MKKSQLGQSQSFLLILVMLIIAHLSENDSTKHQLKPQNIQLQKDVCFTSTAGGSHYSASLGQFTPRCWRGGSNRLSNLGFRRSSEVFAQVTEHWTISVPTLTYGQEIWVVTERTSLQIQVAEMGSALETG